MRYTWNKLLAERTPRSVTSRLLLGPKSKDSFIHVPLTVRSKKLHQLTWKEELQEQLLKSHKVLMNLLSTLGQTAVTPFMILIS